MKGVSNQIRQEFIDNAFYRMDESLRMIEKSLSSLDEEDVWRRPNRVSNSVGNLILHLKGNITQYAIAGLSGQADRRERDLEFSATEGPGKKALLEMLSTTLGEAKSCIGKLTGEELVRVREVQGFRLSGIGIVMHVVEHLSYHTGQIAFWIKLIKNRDLGFYEGIDLNQKNS